jgi:8-amino-7-oxononanoate synthase
MKAMLDDLTLQKASGAFRRLQTRTAPGSGALSHRAQICVEKGLLDFCGNDYLGFAKSNDIRQKLIAQLQDGMELGATGSPLTTGYTVAHETVEHALAQRYQSPSALLISSGFSANTAVMNALSTKEAYFFSDELNHASLIDGMKQSGVKKHIYRHNDLNDLERLLAANASKARSSPNTAVNAVIVSETLFSMDGDLADVAGLIQLAERYDAWLVLDEAHATGVFGPDGLGCLSGYELGRFDARVISIHTASKALGGQGAYILSNLLFRNLLINCARSYIFSTALSPFHAWQIYFAHEQLTKLTAFGANLRTRADAMRARLHLFGGDTLLSQSQIIPLVAGSNARALEVEASLRAQGFLVRAIRHPTVAKGTERLRITIQAHQSAAEEEKFCQAIEEIRL